MVKRNPVPQAKCDYCKSVSLEVDRKNTASKKWDDVKSVFGNENILPMWIADMDFTAPQPVQAAIRQRAEHGVFGYAHKDENFFNCIVNWQNKRHGWETSPDWITTTPGVVPAEAIAVLAFTQPGDEIIIQPPIYPPFFSVVQKNNRTVVENPLVLNDGQYQIDFEDLEQKITAKTKMVIFCSPHNPVGRCWKREELEKFAEIIVRHNLIVISDEIFADLIFHGQKHIPLCSLNPAIANRTILCSAPSKTFNIAGLSTAYTIIPNPELREQFRYQLAGLGLNEINNFGIAALTAAYTEGEQWLSTLLCYLQGNLVELEHFLSARIPQIKLIRPQAAFLAWLDCRAISEDPAVLQDFFVNKAQIGINNGMAFGTQGHGFMRINFACSRALLLEALERIEAALK
ncbi:MAG: PatB family C-S lyase [Negativicutes bacterium]